MKSIALMSEKGGTGKTTSLLNLAAGFARAGMKVLVVDADPQANATMVLTDGQGPGDGATLAEVMAGTARADDALFVSRWEKVELLPASPNLAEVNLSLANEMGRERRLRKAMEPLKSDYEIALVDTGPARSLLNVNVLNWVNEIIVPISPGLFSLAGLGQLETAIDEVKNYLDNATLKLRGLLLTMCERTAVSLDVERQMRELYGDLVFKTTIPRSVRVEEAHSRFQSVFEHSPQSSAARGYSALVEEILPHVERKENRTGKRSGRSSASHDAA
ncbi:MAG: ParA family protein [bacterium]